MPAHQFHLDGILEFHNLPAHVIFRASDRQEVIGKPTALLTPIGIRFLAMLVVQDLGATMDMRSAAGDRKRHNLANARLRRQFHSAPVPHSTRLRVPTI